MRFIEAFIQLIIKSIIKQDDWNTIMTNLQIQFLFVFSSF